MIQLAAEDQEGGDAGKACCREAEEGGDTDGVIAGSIQPRGLQETLATTGGGGGFGRGWIAPPLQNTVP